jgi:Na+/proline symporter
VTVLIIGVLTTFYTMLGGVKAVIWTDAIQVATAFLGFTIVAVSAIHVCRSGGDAKISDHQVGARNQQIPALPCAWKQNLRNPDALVPYYVAAILPHGLIGLVMASIFAGSMSTVSASLNSLATSSVDRQLPARGPYRPLRRPLPFCEPPEPEPSPVQLWASRW